jgi:hypothetical protein
MEKSDGRIAVFICGPVRYVGHVTKRLERVLAGYEYDCFYHLWKADLGNKVRGQEETDISAVESSARTKIIIRQEPYTIEDFRDTIGTKTGSNSSINASMGMFFSVNVLCHCLSLLPDCQKYRYVLRLRTDCVLINDHFAELLDPAADVLTVSKSCFIPENQLCDHIAFGAQDTFFRMWRFDGMQDIYAAYNAGGRNPEKALAAHLAKCGTGIRLNASIQRFQDYHIIYYPPRDVEPGWIVHALNSVGIDGFFDSPMKYFDAAETATFIQTYETAFRKELLTAIARESCNDLDGLVRRLSPCELAELLCVIFETDRALADSAWVFVPRSKGFDVIEPMQTECSRKRDHMPVGSKVLSDKLGLWHKCGILFQTALSRLKTQSWNEAIITFEQALAIGATVPNLYYAYATALAQIGRYGSALSACRHELEVRPEHRGTLELVARLEAAIESNKDTKTVMSGTMYE